MMSPRFWPELTPDSTRSGAWPASRWVMPATTQSAGEPPVTAKDAFGRAGRSSSSRPKVKRCPAPLWLPSGATTQTSSLNSAAMALHDGDAGRIHAVVIGDEDAQAHQRPPMDLRPPI